MEQDSNAQPQQPVEQPAAQAGAQPREMPEQEIAARRLAAQMMTNLAASKEMLEHVLNVVKSASSPAEGVAQATMYAMGGVKGKAKDQQQSELVDMATPLVALEIAHLAAKARAIPDDKTIVRDAIQLIAQPRQEQPPEQPAAQPMPAKPAQPEQGASLLNSPAGYQ